MDRLRAGSSRVIAAVVLALVVVAGCGSDRAPGRIEAHATATGTKDWESTTNAPVISSAAVAGDRILVWARERCDGPVALEVIDAVSGDEAWHSEALDAVGPFEVAVSGDVVLGADADALVAWAVADGAERWRVPAPGGSEVTVAADEDLAVAQGVDEARVAEVAAHDPATGERGWSVVLEPGLQVVDLALAPDVVLARIWGPTSAGSTPRTEVRALDRSTGEAVWRADLGVSELAFPLLVGDGVAVVGMQTISFLAPDSAGGVTDLGPSSAVIALDLDDGDERWRHEADAAEPDVRPGAAGMQAMAVDATTVVGRDGPALVAWEAASGTERWRVVSTAVGAWIAGTSVVAAEVHGDEPGVRVLTLADGAERWTTDPERHVTVADGDGDRTFLVQPGEGPGCES